MMALAAVLTLSAADGWAATATSPRLGIHGDGVTRFVIDLSDAVTFKTSTLADPYRVVIDIPGLDVAGTLAKPWGSVNGMRVEDGRIVLDLRKPAVVRNAFTISPRDGLGWRLVVDLGETTREGFLATVDGAAPVLRPPTAKVTLKPPPVRPEPPVAAPDDSAAPQLTPPPSLVAASPLSGNSGRIVVNSPNADPAPPAMVSPPPPPPVAALPAPAPTAAPAPAPAIAVATPAERSTSRVGAPILSAPMPPPPERPTPPVAMPAPAPVQVVSPPPPPAPVVVAAPPVPAPTPAPESVARGRDGVPVIVIDPGHGGVDPGATGVSGIYEKHITLAMARELKTALEKNGRYRVHLTRDRDVFIRLRDRVAIARQYGADLFISLHADAVQNPQIRGLSVYTLSQNASDNEAQALAEKENKADLIAGIDLSHESADVAGILIDLAQRETMNRSAGFASEVVDEVGQEIDLLGNTHRFAGFAVLKAPDVPAILVEMGYLSNEYEEKQLRQPAYRARLAKAVTKAVERFFPPTLKAKRP